MCLRKIYLPNPVTAALYLLVHHSTCHKLLLDHSCPQELLLDHSCPQELLVDHSCPQELLVDHSCHELLLDHSCPQDLLTMEWWSVYTLITYIEDIKYVPPIPCLFSNYLQMQSTSHLCTKARKTSLLYLCIMGCFFA